MGNDSRIILAMPTELRDKFKVWCNTQNTTMTQMLKSIIKSLVSEPKLKLEV